jgi:hypothetical protein
MQVRIDRFESALRLLNVAGFRLVRRQRRPVSQQRVLHTFPMEQPELMGDQRRQK